MLGKFACHLRRQRTSLKVGVENCKALGSLALLT
jgi:hypothetical protein